MQTMVGPLPSLAIGGWCWLPRTKCTHLAGMPDTTVPRSEATLRECHPSPGLDKLYPGPQRKYDSEGRCQKLADKLYGGCVEPNGELHLHRWNANAQGWSSKLLLKSCPPPAR